MSACCCASEPEYFLDVLRVIERKTSHRAVKCCECGRFVPIGVYYRYELCRQDAGWGGEIEVYETCMLCAAVRDDRMSCGFTFGRLWEDLAYCLEDFDDDDELEGWLDPPDWPIESKL